MIPLRCRGRLLKWNTCSHVPPACCCSRAFWCRCAQAWDVCLLGNGCWSVTEDFSFFGQIGCQFVKINKVGRWKAVGRDAGKKMRCGRDGGISDPCSVVWQHRLRFGVLFGGFMFLQFLFYSRLLNKVWTHLLFKEKTDGLSFSSCTALLFQKLKHLKN